MKRNSKRRHPFVVVYNTEIDGESCQTFIVLLQSPKVPERYAWLWALKKVRDWLHKCHIPFENWTRYEIYPVKRFNCSQWETHPDDRFYSHIHVADYPEEDDKSGIDWYNNIKSKYACKIK